MENIVFQLSKYIIIIFTTIYTLYCFTAFRSANKVRQRNIFHKQSLLMYLVHFICYGLLFLDSKNIKVVYLYFAQVAFFILVKLVYKLVYKKLSAYILNNMLFLIMISFVILTRLSFDMVIKQFMIVGASFGICLVVPVIIEKFKYLSKLGWIYGFVGLSLLLLVLVFGTTKYGATNWINVFGILIQPSEFVKIIFVFFIASLLSEYKEFKDLIKITILAAVYVLVFVVSRDLGSALIFFVTFLIVLYAATKKSLYLFSGFGLGSIAAYIAYFLFSHVKVRVTAWRDPWTYIDKEGYQVAQSLFAIGTGGWFGLGLAKGLPNSIPVVESDFIFSAISEELGAITAICIILICLSCFVMFINIAMKMKKEFYKLVALGLSTMYIFQVFLTIGGAIKFIPSTGVTLPLVSYGGSSALSTIIMFSIIQGMYVLNQNEVGNSERRKTKKEKIQKADEQEPERE